MSDTETMWGEVPTEPAEPIAFTAARKDLLHALTPPGASGRIVAVVMTADTDTGPLTGSDLRLMRYARRVTSTALARRYGVTRARISNLEAMERPTRDAVARYLRALGEATKDR